MSIWEIVFYLGIVISYFVFEKFRISRVEKSMHSLNTHFGAPFSPRLYRQLRPDEITLIKGESNRYIKSWHIVGLLVVGSFFIFVVLNELMWNRLLINLLISVSILILVIQLHYKNRMYADTISPVMKLVGPLSWPLNLSPQGRDAKHSPVWQKFFVGKESFKIGLVQSPELYAKIVETLHADDLVEIEYTPHTRTVLNVYKYNGRD